MLTEKPRPMRTSRPAIPEHVEFAVQHALEKLPADRFSTAREFAEAMQGRSATGTTTYFHQSQQPASAGWKSRLRDPLTAGLGALALIALVVSAFSFSGRRSSNVQTAPVSRFVLWTPDSIKPGSNFPWPATISPDGGTVVYKPRSSRLLYAVRTDQLDSRALPGTEDAGQVIFSPDGQWIAFESNGKLRKVRLDGSTPIAVSTGNSYNGGDWTVRDEIVLGSEGKARGLSVVSANGGTPVEFTKPPSDKTDYLWPIASPDGKSVVFTVWDGNLASAKLATASISNGKVTPLNLSGIRPLAILDHTLVYLQADGLTMGVKLKGGFNGTDGPPVPVLDPVVVSAGLNGNSEIFVSPRGALVTSRGGTSSQMVWFTANGTTIPILSEVRRYGAPRISPDGRRIVVAVSDADGSDLWIHDLAGRTFSRLTSSKTATSPVWSADGTKVYFIGLDPANHFAIWSQSVDGGAVPEKVTEAIGPTLGMAGDPDGQSLVYTGIRDNAWAINRVLLDSGGKKVPFPREGTNEVSPAISPDGRWIALVSDQAGGADVFMRSYPVPSVRLQVSAAGGTEPAWSQDGKRIYYRNGNAMMAATIETSPAVRVVARDTVAADLRNITASGSGNGYDIARDGRFLGRLSNRDDYQLVVVPNWRAELEARLASAARR
jgi:serine/threonine-protein kinase